MGTVASSRCRAACALLAAAAFVVSALFGPALFGRLSAPTAMGLMAPDCAMSGHGSPSVCPMGAAQHLASWRSFAQSDPRRAPALPEALPVAASHSAVGERAMPAPAPVLMPPERPPDLVRWLISRGIVQPTVYG